jgi:translation initiation factor 1A
MSRNKTKNKTEIVFKEEDNEYYGTVSKCLGDCRFIVNFENGSIICTLKKSIRKKMFIIPGTVVLISVRTYQPDHGDIIYTYTRDETLNLISRGEYNEKIKKEEKKEKKEKKENIMNDDIDIVFDDI